MADTANQMLLGTMQYQRTNVAFVCNPSISSQGLVYAGRVQTILLFKFIGVTLLALIGLFPSLWTSAGIVIPAYIIRTAVMNSAFPLQKSILMDYVSKVTQLLRVVHIALVTQSCMQNTVLVFVMFTLIFNTVSIVAADCLRIGLGLHQ